MTVIEVWAATEWVRSMNVWRGLRPRGLRSARPLIVKRPNFTDGLQSSMSNYSAGYQRADPADFVLSSRCCGWNAATPSSMFLISKLFS